MRVTIACPEALIPDAQDLAMVLGYGPADAGTYQTASWQDAAGNRYAVASAMVFGVFVEKATTELERPEWDVEPYVVNMAGARRAQAVVAIGEGPASPDVLRAVFGDDAQAALAIMGVTPITAPEEI